MAIIEVFWKNIVEEFNGMYYNDHVKNNKIL